MKSRKQSIQNQLQALQRDVHNETLQQRELEEKIRKVTSVKQLIRRQYDELSNEAEPEVHDLNNLVKTFIIILCACPGIFDSLGAINTMPYIFFSLGKRVA